MTERHFLPED